jgi:hypothetical protein
MKKTGYSEIDAMFVTTDLSSELEEFKVYYEELSKIKNNELKKLLNNLKNEEKKLKQILELEFKKEVEPSIAILIDFHKKALLELDLYGEGKGSNKTHDTKQWLVKLLEKFSCEDFSWRMKWEPIALYHSHNYDCPRSYFSFEQWLRNCQISLSKNITNYEDLLSNGLSGFEKVHEIIISNRFKLYLEHPNNIESQEERLTYLNLVFHCSKIRNLAKIISALKPYYENAAKAEKICSEHITKEINYYKKFGSKFKKRIKTISAIIEGVSLKHLLLEYESEYNERLY